MNIELVENAELGELWVIAHSDRLVDLPTVITSMSRAERDVFTAYDPTPVGHERLQPDGGYRWCDGWIFESKEQA